MNGSGQHSQGEQTVRKPQRGRSRGAMWRSPNTHTPGAKSKIAIQSSCREREVAGRQKGSRCPGSRPHGHTPQQAPAELTQGAGKFQWDLSVGKGATLSHRHTSQPGWLQNGFYE